MSSPKTGVTRESTPNPPEHPGTIADGHDPPYTRRPPHPSLGDHPTTVRQTARPPAATPAAHGARGNTLVRTALSGNTTTSETGLPPPVPAERLRTLESVAAGGMGVVESAFDNVLMRRVARKTMHVEAGEHPQLTQRFIEEAQITAQLDHPNIVPVHDLAASVEQGKVFFTMKLVDGETLGSIFQRLHSQAFSGLELERVLRIFLKVCDAVSFAHSRGVVHRDLKPDNIMVGSHGQVYVMDWGVALLQRESVDEVDGQPISVARPFSTEEAGTVVGTIRYMSPEQAFGLVAQQGPFTDVYGLGAILYELLTGVAPCWAPSVTESLKLARSGPVPPPESRPAWPTLPPGLCRIAMKALSPRPQDRQASVDALRQDVEDFLRGGGWFQMKTFLPGSVIVGEGDQADAAFLVTRGNCEVFRAVEGERQVVRRIGPGEIFGEMGLLTRSPRTASVAALDTVTVMVITPEALDHELSQSGWLRELVRALAVRFRELDQMHSASSPESDKSSRR